MRYAKSLLNSNLPETLDINAIHLCGISSRRFFIWRAKILILSFISMAKFYAQIFFSSVLLSFCFYKLLVGVPDTQLAVYWGGVTAVLGYWLPSPKAG